MDRTRTRIARRTARRTAPLAVGLALATVGAAPPASAVAIKTGHGKINVNGLSFGTGTSPTTGVASGNATFTWHLVSGVTELNVVGTFGAFNRSGVPVRLYTKYYDGLSGTGRQVSKAWTAGFTPASGSLTTRAVNFTAPGAVGVQSAKVCVASDADRDGVYLLERCILSTL